MPAQDLLQVSRLNEPTARLALAMLQRMDAVWLEHPAGMEFSLSNLVDEWLQMINGATLLPAASDGPENRSCVDPNPPSPAVCNFTGPERERPPANGLPNTACPVHAAARLAALALALDLLELRARYPSEPADWVGRLALDRRMQIKFVKPAPLTNNHK